jgi:hypothetical protein
VSAIAANRLRWTRSANTNKYDPALSATAQFNWAMALIFAVVKNNEKFDHRPIFPGYDA